MESKSSQSSQHFPPRRSNRRDFVRRRIEPAIRSKSCPICLNQIEERRAAVITACLHAYCVDCIRKWSNLKRKCPMCNANFDAWFFRINLPFRTFHVHKLPALSRPRAVNYAGSSRRDHRRLLQRSRQRMNHITSRSRPLPRRRCFGSSGSESSRSAAERVLQWRASIYEEHLQAVPFTEQGIAGNIGLKERILTKIEPWIHRELQAILGDPDPSIILHVVSSLFISSLERRELPSRQSQDDDLQPLWPFLHEKTTMFWHELRCFAESPFNMETYDTVVEYRNLSK